MLVVLLVVLLQVVFSQQLLVMSNVSPEYSIASFSSLHVIPDDSPSGLVIFGSDRLFELGGLNWLYDRLQDAPHIKLLAIIAFESVYTPALRGLIDSKTFSSEVYSKFRPLLREQYSVLGVRFQAVDTFDDYWPMYLTSRPRFPGIPYFQRHGLRSYDRRHLCEDIDRLMRVKHIKLVVTMLPFHPRSVLPTTTHICEGIELIAINSRASKVLTLTILADGTISQSLMPTSRQAFDDSRQFDGFYPDDDGRVPKSIRLRQPVLAHSKPSSSFQASKVSSKFQHVASSGYGQVRGPRFPSSASTSAFIMQSPGVLKLPSPLYSRDEFAKVVRQASKRVVPIVHLNLDASFSDSNRVVYQKPSNSENRIRRHHSAGDYRVLASELEDSSLESALRSSTSTNSPDSLPDSTISSLGSDSVSRHMYGRYRELAEVNPLAADEQSLSRVDEKCEVFIDDGDDEEQLDEHFRMFDDCLMARRPVPMTPKELRRLESLEYTPSRGIPDQKLGELKLGRLSRVTEETSETQDESSVPPSSQTIRAKPGSVQSPTRSSGSGSSGNLPEPLNSSRRKSLKTNLFYFSDYFASLADLHDSGHFHGEVSVHSLQVIGNRGMLGVGSNLVIPADDVKRRVVHRDIVDLTLVLLQLTSPEVYSEIAEKCLGQSAISLRKVVRTVMNRQSDIRVKCITAIVEKSLSGELAHIVSLAMEKVSPRASISQSEVPVPSGQALPTISEGHESGLIHPDNTRSIAELLHEFAKQVLATSDLEHFVVEGLSDITFLPTTTYSTFDREATAISEFYNKVSLYFPSGSSSKQLSTLREHAHFVRNNNGDYFVQYLGAVVQDQFLTNYLVIQPKDIDQITEYNFRATMTEQCQTLEQYIASHPKILFREFINYIASIAYTVTSYIHGYGKVHGNINQQSVCICRDKAKLRFRFGSGTNYAGDLRDIAILVTKFTHVDLHTQLQSYQRGSADLPSIPLQMGSTHWGSQFSNLLELLTTSHSPDEGEVVNAFNALRTAIENDRVKLSSVPRDFHHN